MENSDFLKKLKRFQAKKLALLQDDSSPEQFTAIVSPAEEIEPSTVNTILHVTGGHLFVALDAKRAEGFMLPPMSARRSLFDRPRPSTKLLSTRRLTDACVSVEARAGVTTGISAADRATTIAVLGAREPNPRELVQPGHVFPVTVRSGGVLVKHALAEGAFDLVSCSGASSAAVYADLLNEAGAFANEQEQQKIAEQFDLPVFSLSELIQHRLQTEKLVERVASAMLPTESAGEMIVYVYRSKIHDGEHVALVKGEIHSDEPTLVRVQAESTFSDVFASCSNRSRARLHEALSSIGERGKGVLVYLRRPYQGGLLEELGALERQSPMMGAAVMREYGLGAQILRDLGVSQIDLLTGTEKNLVGLKPFGIEIVSQCLLKRTPRESSNPFSERNIANSP